MYCVLEGWREGKGGGRERERERERERDNNVGGRETSWPNKWYVLCFHKETIGSTTNTGLLSCDKEIKETRRRRKRESVKWCV